MHTKRLGNTDLEVAPVTLGGNVFGWTADEKTSFEILDHFTGAGFNLVDTADVYSRWAPGNKGGESETVIGNWLKKTNKRDKIFISTKVGSDLGDGKKGLRKKYILEAVDSSLQRLQTDHIDLYQTHFDDVSVPVEETLQAYDEMVKAGKVRWIGTSNMTPERILESIAASKANNYPVYQTLQPHYNLVDRSGYEKNYEQLCLDYELGVINYFALASGFLTGKYRTQADISKHTRGDQVEKYLN
ncbi:MAG: aldo/keto reductase, partial [Pedobacter sp.]